MDNEIRRATGLLVIEVVNSNPNGDPDRESDPRQRPNGCGEISPVSFKRKLRDLLDDHDTPFFRSLPEKFRADADRYCILEHRGRDRKQITAEMGNEPEKFLQSEFVRKYWDARVFGNTFLEDGGNKGFIKTGVVQFSMGLSLAPVDILLQTNTNEAGVQEGKNAGMAPLAYRIVEHGVYCMPFFVNPNYAQKSGCTAEDIELLKLLIPHAYELNRSAIRPDVRIRHAWYLEHKSLLGSCPDYQLLEALTPEQEQMPPLRAEERLAALDRYVSALGGDDARSALRRQMYAACRDAKITDGFAACDSPVGSGKTTAVMAHLLRQAVRRKSRRIFVILPYTSIIQQSVDVYRKALVLPGEDPAKVVAELHCRADFEDMDTRYLTALWRAPIVVTTAVAFFETMASNRPSALRRLHELPGSVVFVDEAHNALPIDLLPLAWGWMNALAEEWGCYWVLASGSLVRYWALPRLMAFRIPQPNVCELVPEHLRAELMQYETGRIRFQWEPEPLSRQALCQRVQASLGPRLLILNTVQSAAVFASDLCDAYGREAVEHLSTALTAVDRAAASERIKKRLQDQTDTDWTLVATSCVEAGVDFSFRTGFREVSSLLSLLQAAGRVNRHGTESEAEMWSFRLKDDSMLRPNKALHIEQEVLQRYFMKRMEITPELSTGFLNDVLAQDGSCLQKISSLLQEEENLEFADIEEKFKVIEENTVLAVVDEALAKRILFGKADWTELQKNSVSVRKSNIRAWNLKEIGDGLYQWTLRYDPFLGYMRGVLDMERAKHGFLNC